MDSLLVLCSDDQTLGFVAALMFGSSNFFFIL